MVTGIYPSLDSLKEELSRKNAPETYDGTKESPLHRGMQCQTVIQNGLKTVSIVLSFKTS